MTVQPIDRHIGAALINTEGVCQVIAQRIQVALRLLDLGELFSAAGFCNEIDRQLVRAGAADKVREVGKLQGPTWLLGLWRNWCR